MVWCLEAVVIVILSHKYLGYLLLRVFKCPMKLRCGENVGDPLKRIRCFKGLTLVMCSSCCQFSRCQLWIILRALHLSMLVFWGFFFFLIYIYYRLWWWMSGRYPLFSLLPELLSLGSDKPSSLLFKEFVVLFRTKREAMQERFWIRHARNKHIDMLGIIRTHLMGTKTLSDEYITVQLALQCHVWIQLMPR